MSSNPTYNEETSGIEVAAAYSTQASGKTILITGVSNGGIGEATARAFAHGGAHIIIITGRNEERLYAVLKILSSDYPETKFRTLRLDLDSLAATRQSALEILNDASVAKIDIIVTNAGFSAFTGDRALTVDGYERHFGINHLAHFLFVTKLLPKLRLAAEKSETHGLTRIIALTSGAMAASPIRFSNYNFDDKPTAEEDILDLGPLKTLLGIGQLGPGGYDASIAYGQSKTANTLFAVQLNTLLASKGIFAFSVNPGIVYSTGSKKVYDTFDDKQRKDLAAFGIMKTIDQGSATTIVAALDPGLTPEAGTYLVNCQIADAMAPAYATSKEMAERLWKLSENLVGEIVRI